jgi:hypothetical protein
VAWSDLIRRRHPASRVTAVEVAASLAEVIVQNTNTLRARIEVEGFTRMDPVRAGSDECLLECMIFEWFLRDVMASVRSEGPVEAVRRALAGRLLVDLLRSGCSVPELDYLDRRQHDRFEEYEQALEVSASLQPLGALAWRRISGDGQPSERMTMLLAIRARAELAQSLALE